MDKRMIAASSALLSLAALFGCLRGDRRTIRGSSWENLWIQCSVTRIKAELSLNGRSIGTLTEKEGKETQAEFNLGSYVPLKTENDLTFALSEQKNSPIVNCTFFDKKGLNDPRTDLVDLKIESKEFSRKQYDFRFQFEEKK